MNNGYTTGPFQILKGVRQGDPLSPYLFIICLEILVILVCDNKDIQGIQVDGDEIKLEIFADDLTMFLRNSLMSFEPRHKKDFVLNDLIQLRFRKQDVLAQARSTDQFFNSPLDWKAIYKLPFKVAMDTKTRLFQYKILNKYLPTNSFLYKVGLKPSALCAFCDEESETLTHLFIYCMLPRNSG